MMRGGRDLAFLGLALVMLLGPGMAAASPSGGYVAPAWTLPDTAGRVHALRELRGRPHLLFFFCGCVPCHDCARLWAQAQRGGELGGATPTVVVFLGNAAQAKAFVAETDLDLTRTLLLTDPADRVSLRYGVAQCPRVFVLDAQDHAAYTNPDGGHAGPAVLTAPALVSRALTAWRHLTPPPSGTTP